MPTREQRRLARTKFVHRWHAAQTIGERLGNDAVGERFEHINHARSLAEYVWRYGVFEESGDETGRVARQDMPYGLCDVVAPVAAKGTNHLRMAAGYALIAAGLGRDGRDSSGDGRTNVPVAPERQQLLRYAEQHPEIKLFAAGIIALQSRDVPVLRADAVPDTGRGRALPNRRDAAVRTALASGRLGGPRILGACGRVHRRPRRRE